MKQLKLVCLTILFLTETVSANLAPLPPSLNGRNLTSVAPLQQGVALGLYEKDPDKSYLQLLKEIKALGATHVSIVHPWYMKTALDAEIYADPIETTPWKSMVKCVDDATSAGLDVFLFPILRVTDKTHGWRGTLKPKDVNLFFKNYTALIVKFAKLAEEKHLTILSIGSELASMEKHENKWRALIEQVRKIYHGKLIYSANWDAYQNTPFIDALDLAGVTGYFELAEENKPTTTSDLIHAWRYIYFDLLRWSQKHKKPIVITEVGYLSTTNAAAWPWKEAARNVVDVEIQRKAYEAFRRFWNREPNLRGVYFWQWFGEGGPTDHEYTPRNKPAAKEIEIWYGGKSF